MKKKCEVCGIETDNDEDTCPICKDILSTEFDDGKGDVDGEL